MNNINMKTAEKINLLQDKIFADSQNNTFFNGLDQALLSANINNKQFDFAKLTQKEAQKKIIETLQLYEIDYLFDEKESDEENARSIFLEIQSSFQERNQLNKILTLLKICLYLNDANYFLNYFAASFYYLLSEYEKTISYCQLFFSLQEKNPSLLLKWEIPVTLTEITHQISQIYNLALLQLGKKAEAFQLFNKIIEENKKLDDSYLHDFFSLVVLSEDKNDIIQIGKIIIKNINKVLNQKNREEIILEIRQELQIIQKAKTTVKS